MRQLQLLGGISVNRGPAGASDHNYLCASHRKSGLTFGGVVSEQWGMTCTVKVKDGAIPLPPGVELSDGAEVLLTIPDSVAQPSFAERYAAYIGVAADLPPDLASNVDHYVHGHRKK